MLAATLLLMLHAMPEVAPSFLTDGMPRRVRLVVDEADPMPSYEGWTRVQLQEEYDRLETIRPGVLLPVTLIAFGASDVAISGIAMISGLTNFFGIAVAVAIGLTIAIVIGAGMAIIGAIILYRNAAERRTLGKQMDAIEAAYRDGRCRSAPGSRPCYDESPTAPQPQQPVQDPAFIPPQVLAPAGYPILVATF